MLVPSRGLHGWGAGLVALGEFIMQSSAVSRVSTSAALGAAPARGVVTAAAARPAGAPALQAPFPQHRSTFGGMPPTPQPPRGTRIAAAAGPAATAEAAPCELYAAAYSAALEAGSSLRFSYISHWQQQEEQRLERRAIINATRGRRQQRMRQLATLVFSSPCTDDASAGGRPLAGISQQAGQPSSWQGSSGSLDLPPLQQMSEMDDLSWLASHPPEEAAAAAAAGIGSSGSPSLWSLGQHQAAAAAAQQQQQQPGAGMAADGSSGAAAAALRGPVQLRVEGELVNVRPLWISVYQPDASGPAKLFESVTPLLPDLADRLAFSLSPFCTVTGMTFSGADEAAAGWRNFFVGVVGSVAAAEEDILWPNQVLHRDRVLYNVRNGWDVAKFLADPRKEDVEQHRDNLLRLAEERRYRRGWCWHMLRLRWGESTLKRLGVDVC